MNFDEKEILAAARAALLQAGAIEPCDEHPDTLVWRLDEAADENALELALGKPRAIGTIWRLEDMRSAILSVLEESSEGECDKCWEEGHAHDP